MYTIKPSDIVKFESTNFIPVPNNWATASDTAAVRNNAVNGSIKIITINNRGVGIGTANRTYTRVPIKGNGIGAEATVVINNDQTVDSVTVSSQGSGYTYGTLDLNAGGIPSGTTIPSFDVIISPDGGHGKDIYRELGAYNVLVYSRIENDTENPDFETGNEFARIGIVENPKSTPTSILQADKASALGALKITGVGYSSAVFTLDGEVTQTVAAGSTAVGRVVSYDQTTGVLKYWQDRTLAGFNTVGTAQTDPTYGYDLVEFTSNPTSPGTLDINHASVANLSIESSFSGISTVINNRTYYLGQTFTNGISSPEVEKYTGNIIYVDNRPSITRSSNQKEDIKVILQF